MKKYVEAELDIIAFDVDDMIITSLCNNDGCQVDGHGACGTYGFQCGSHTYN